MSEEMNMEKKKSNERLQQIQDVTLSRFANRKLRGGECRVTIRHGRLTSQIEDPWRERFIL